MFDATVPIYHVSGWYDDVLIGTLENYVAMATRPPTSRRAGVNGCSSVPGATA